MLKGVLVFAVVYIRVQSQSWTASSLLFLFAKLLHAKPKHASGELSREKRWFAIALDEIRTRRILRKKADC